MYSILPDNGLYDRKAFYKVKNCFNLLFTNDGDFINYKYFSDHKWFIYRVKIYKCICLKEVENKNKNKNIHLKLIYLRHNRSHVLGSIYQKINSNSTKT